MNALEPSLDSIDALSDVDAFLLLVTEEDRPLSGAAGYLDWRMCGALSRVLLSGFFSGKAGEQLLMPIRGLRTEKLFAVGAGASARISADSLGEILEAAAKAMVKAKVQSVALSLPSCPLSDADKVLALKKGFVPSFPGPTTVIAEKAIRGLL